MKRFLKLYSIEQKLGLRSGDMLLFGVAMPVGIMILISMIAGNKMAGDGFTFLESSFASLVTVGICASAFMGIPLTISEYRDKKILKHFFTTPCSPIRILGAVMLCATVSAILSALSVTFVSAVFLKYRMKGNIAAFAGSWFLTLLSMYSIGLLMASLCRTVKAVNATATLVYFPMLFLSGATIPYEIFPKGLQKFSDVLPLTQGIKLMKAVSMGNGIHDMWKIVMLLFIIAICCIGVSVRTFRWE